jgi:hypothetical protein
VFLVGCFLFLDFFLDPSSRAMRAQGGLAKGSVSFHSPLEFRVAVSRLLLLLLALSCLVLHVSIRHLLCLLYHLLNEPR